MEDIKTYLDRSSKKHWRHLRDNPPALLDKVGKEITTDKMQDIIREDAKAFDKMDNMLDKLDQCLAIQERNIQRLDHIIEIIE